MEEDLTKEELDELWEDLPDIAIVWEPVEYFIERFEDYLVTGELEVIKYNLYNALDASIVIADLEKIDFFKNKIEELCTYKTMEQ